MTIVGAFPEAGDFGKTLSEVLPGLDPDIVSTSILR